MGSIQFLVKGKRNPSTIYCRYINTRQIDITVKTHYEINPKFWDKKKQKAKNVIALRNRDELNRSLDELKISITDSFNVSYRSGEIIDKTWLEEVIKSFNNRPKDEDKFKIDDSKVYFTDFSIWWLDSKGPKWLTSASEFMTSRSINQHKNIIKIFKDFEEDKKVKLTDIGNVIISDFVLYMQGLDYASSYINRNIKRLRFLIDRAVSENLKVNLTYKHKVLTPKESDILDPFLNEEELNKIYSVDLSDDKNLNDVRDNLIISCWTALRISDFKKLDISSFIDGYIYIKETQKTKARLVIPVHPMVEGILIKRKGQLPGFKNEKDFNLDVKIVCKKAGIRNIIKGRIFDKEKKRKIEKTQEKYKFVSSHIGRRSFATNLDGKIDRSIIMKVGGWKTEKVYENYIKKSKDQYAKELRKVYK